MANELKSANSPGDCPRGRSEGDSEETGQHSEEEQSHSHMSRFGGASPRTVGKGRTTEFRQLTVEDFHKIKKSIGLSIVQTKVVQHYRRENPDLLKASLSKK